MEFALSVALELFIMAIVLLWAAWSRLDLGLCPPRLKGVWPWIALYVVASGAIWVLDVLLPAEVEPGPPGSMELLSMGEELVLACLLFPLFEELLFRGAMFDALFRRWGIWTAAIVPSLIWALIHLPDVAWWGVLLFGKGVVLAIIRWKSGSLLVPLALHMGYNFFVTLGYHL
jgi:membrane protease YdiL (CAAX protease family)